MTREIDSEEQQQERIKQQQRMLYERLSQEGEIMGLKPFRNTRVFVRQDLEDGSFPDEFFVAFWSPLDIRLVKSPEFKVDFEHFKIDFPIADAGQLLEAIEYIDQLWKKLGKGYHANRIFLEFARGLKADTHEI